MKPGSELDLLVAEKVMGLSPYKSFGDYRYEHNSNLRDSILPRYSTDIAAAWKVVEEFYRDNLFEINWNHATKKWHASINEHTKASDTAPHAICLAALKCKGVEV